MGIIRFVAVAAFVLLGIKYLRPGQIPVFAYVILILLISGLRNRQVNVLGKNVRMIFSILWLYLLIQLFDLLRSDNLNQSILELLKYAALIVALFVFIKFYPFAGLAKDIKLFSVLSSILLLVFFVNSLYVLKTSYLSADLFIRTEQGKNGLAMFGALSGIVSFWLLIATKNRTRWLYAVCFMVSVCSVIFTQSRGAVFTLAASLGTVFFLYYRFTAPQRGFRYFKLVFAVAATSVLVGYLFSSFANFNARDYVEELTSLGTGRLTQSDEIRKDLLDKAWRLFIDNPILGVGSNNFLYKYGLLTHNQYLQFAVENGFFMALGFIAVFVLIAIRFFQFMPKNVNNVLYLIAFNTAVFIFLYFVFINAYDSILIEFCLISSAWILDDSIGFPHHTHA